VVNLQITGDIHKPTEASIAAQVEALAELQRKDLAHHVGLSNVTAT
jgi:aryl-alcohol dehydrogenase-like predicted oxidoreductase